MQQEPRPSQPTHPPPEDDRAVRSIPLDTEDGGQVVIEQQNVGPDNQVGGGEFKNVAHGRTPDEAAEEQAHLDADAPVPGEDEGSERASDRP